MRVSGDRFGLKTRHEEDAEDRMIPKGPITVERSWHHITNDHPSPKFFNQLTVQGIDWILVWLDLATR
jgi:hypothetical protein